MRWLVIVDSLQSLFTANLHASWLSARRTKITVKFPWQQHETPREQFYSRLWQERHDRLCMEPWRERLVCSIIGCDTAWRRLHSANDLFFCDAFVQVNWVVPSNRCGVCAVGFLTERHHLSNADLWRLLFFISLSIMHFFTVKMCLFYSTRQHRFPLCSLQYEISIRPAFEARLSRVIHKIPVNFPSKSLCCCMVMQFIGKVTISHYALSPVPGGSRRKFRGQQNGFGASQQNSVLLKKQK